MSIALIAAQQAVAGHMDRIVNLFKPGVKIAVIVRTPGQSDRDFMMTDDDADELIALIQRRKERP